MRRTSCCQEGLFLHSQTCSAVSRLPRWHTQETLHAGSASRHRHLLRTELQQLSDVTCIPAISKQSSTSHAHLHGRLDQGVQDRGKLSLCAALLLAATKAGLEGGDQILQLVHELCHLHHQQAGFHNDHKWYSLRHVTYVWLACAHLLRQVMVRFKDRLGCSKILHCSAFVVTTVNMMLKAVC